MKPAANRRLAQAGVWFVALAMMFAAANADADAIDPKANYPEGPVLIGGMLFYAEMSADRVTVWDGTSRRTFFRRERCGPTSISPMSDERLAILCHLENAVVIVSMSGDTIKVIRKDAEGARLTLPNDSHSDRTGGVYFSSSGTFHISAQPSGRLFHLAADDTVTQVAEGLSYSNGVFVTPERVLYVSEHMGKKILRYRIEPDNTLTPIAAFADIAAIDDQVGEAPARVGPDGLEVMADGTVYVCIYGAGKILKLSASGALLNTIETEVRYVTNLVIDLATRRMIVTGAHSNTEFPFIGMVYEIAMDK